MFLLAAFSLPSAEATLKTEEVEYTSGGLTMKGWLVYDESFKGKRPGILVVHEWWGHNDYARKRAEMLAVLGYTALAVDMYGDGKQAGHPQDAGKFASEVMSSLPVAKGRFLAALDVLKKHPTVSGDNIGAIGYCFGGGVVLHMLRMGVDLKGVVSFHGSLGTLNPAKPGVVKAKALVCHGEEDSFVSKEEIEGFKQEMKLAKVDMDFKTYKGAKHSFTNPSADDRAAEFKLNLAYNEDADKASWNDMKAFFKKVFRKK